MTSRIKGDPEQKKPPADDSGILIEFHHVGNAVKVTAVDPRSLLEASIVGDPAMGETALTRAAVQKLRYVLARRSRKAGEEDAKGPTDPWRDRRGGTLV